MNFFIATLTALLLSLNTLVSANALASDTPPNSRTKSDYQATYRNPETNKVPVEIKWTEYNKNEQYQIEISKNGDFSNSKKFIRSRPFFPLEVHSDKKYFWRVQRVNQKDEIISEYSDTFNFTVHSGESESKQIIAKNYSPKKISDDNSFGEERVVYKDEPVTPIKQTTKESLPTKQSQQSTDEIFGEESTISEETVEMDSPELTEDESLEEFEDDVIVEQ